MGCGLAKQMDILFHAEGFKMPAKEFVYLLCFSPLHCDRDCVATYGTDSLDKTHTKNTEAKEQAIVQNLTFLN